MIKKLVVSVVLLLVLVVGAGFYYFDSIIKNGIEVVGSQLLGTGVTVSSVSISPLAGTGSIRGLSIRNVEGFDSDYAFQLEEVEVVLNAGSVLTDVVEIESVRIVQPDITYETRITTDNIRALMQNLPTGGYSTGQESTDSAGKQLIIREFQMLDPQLNLVTAIATAPILLPDIQLINIGSADDSASVAEVLRLILSSLSTSILNANLPSLDDLREGVEERLQETVEEAETAVEDAVEELGGRLRSILN